MVVEGKAVQNERLQQLLQGLKAVRDGDFSTRLPRVDDVLMDEMSDVFNGMVDQLALFTSEVTRVAREVGTDGKLGGQAVVPGVSGTWKDLTDSVNAMAGNLTGQVRDIAEVATAVAKGDLTQKITVDVKGEMLALKNTINTMVDQLSSFADEVTRVAREVGSEGRLGGQATVPGVAGTWRDLTTSVNFMAGNLTDQVRNVAQVTTAVAKGDLTQKITVDARGEILELKNTINTMVDQLSSFADEVTRVAREVGTDGILGGQAQVPGVGGTWRALTTSVNFMAGNLTGQVRSIAQVATAVARGDLTQKITVDARGEILELKNTINTMVDQLSSFADEVTRVAREVGTDGKLGGQADVKGVSGTWKDLTDSVNVMADNLTDQVRSIAQVTTAVARGDLSQKIRVDARGEILELKDTINTMVDQLSAFADEVTRVARDVGTQGDLGGQAIVRGVSGTWKDLTDNVNVMASNLTGQVRSIAQVATAVAQGDLTKRIRVEAKGEVAGLADTINTMVDTLSAFADEVTRVAREVGTEGMLGGQARVPGVAGTWKDLTDNVNFMAGNLTSQVRNIAQVTTAVAQGDLSKKIDVDARGEILELKTTINTMVDTLSSFAAEVTRVAREVGSEGRLGGQAEVEGVSGTWKRLTENVNELAGNLTRQVRAIAEVTSAVATGDLTRSISVEAQGEVAELKDNINAMVQSLRETTRANEDQDWLNTNLARFSGLMQGHRELGTVAELIMNELTPLVDAQLGTFFLAETGEDDVTLRLVAGYGTLRMGGEQHDELPTEFRLGQSLVGQVASTKKAILVDQTPADYVRIASSLGSAGPANLIVLPIVFEDQALGVIELASFGRFTPVQRDFLEQLMETIGVNVNTIIANARTDSLLAESQRLTQELRARSEQLQEQQGELRRSNAELARQNRDIEVKNFEIEQARQELEERAQQLALTSKYKSEFLANMSHELRTPLNSLLILARLLAQNPTRNLTPKQVEFANVIHSAGTDLLQLIDDILDLSKVEAGKMDIHPERFPLPQLLEYVRATFQPLTWRRASASACRWRRTCPSTSTPTSRGCGRSCATCCPTRSSSPRPAGSTWRAAGRRHHRVRRVGHRHRHRAGQPGDHFRRVPAGRRHHQPALRRHRPRPVHQPRGGLPARRRDQGGERARRRQHVHPAPAGRAGDRRAGAGGRTGGAGRAPAGAGAGVRRRRAVHAGPAGRRDPRRPARHRGVDSRRGRRGAARRPAPGRGRGPQPARGDVADVPQAAGQPPRPGGAAGVRAPVRPLTPAQDRLLQSHVRNRSVELVEGVDACGNGSCGSCPSRTTSTTGCAAARCW
ncbi:hypothetical protein GCM10018954_059860 [Kutzneria kofuensis]